MSSQETKPPVSENEVLKIRAFVEKLGSLEKAREALEALEKIRKAA
ncbi:MAG: hypothetical protein KDA84_11530 [Planctomycetaceae bacterium]|nr:hypothetical protein [Planctomycetaceae bacterium]